MVTNIEKQARMRRLLGLVAIGVLCLIIYFPSLNHIARSDHLLYLSHFADTSDFKTLAIDSHGFNRTNPWVENRNVLLYRPMLYFVMGVEKWAFGYNFALWQLIGIVLHLVVCYFLLGLLRTIDDGMWAYFFTAFFAVMFAGMEIVIWHHINGYLIFIALSLFTLKKVIQYTRDLERKESDLWAIGISLFFASLFYELGVLMAILIIIYLLCLPDQSTTEKTNTTLLLLAVIGSYVAMSVTDYFIKGCSFDHGQEVIKAFSPEKTVANIWMSFRWWIYSGLFPTELSINPLLRTSFFPVDLLEGKRFLKLSVLMKPAVISALVLFVMYIVSLVKGFKKKNLRFSLLLLGIILMFAALIVVGRINLRSLEYYLKNNPYNTYIFWAYFIVLLYSLVDFKKLETLQFQKILKNGTILLLVTLILTNAFYVFKLNREKARKDRPLRILTQEIERLRMQPENKVGFTFGFDESAKIFDQVYPFVDPQQPDQEITYFELLYPRQHRKTAPKYTYTSKGEDYYWIKKE